MSKPASKPAPQFRPITPLEVPDSVLDAINDKLGVPTMVRHQSTEPVPAPRPVVPQPASKPAHDATMKIYKLSLELPRYLSDSIKRTAIERRTTVRHILMLGLVKLGFDIKEEDLVEDARRRRKSS